MTSLSMTGTFSKHPRAWGFPDDLVVTIAQGATVGLSDGRYYIDWVSGLGSNLFGYGYFHEQLANELQGGGGSLSLPHRLEYKAAGMLADLLGDRIPYWRNKSPGVRFATTGTEAVTMAVRLARAITGREILWVCRGGYHGWADWTICRSEPARGVVKSLRQNIREFAFNNLVDFEQFAGCDYPAAIIIEQGLETPGRGFYQAIREFCSQNGVLLIMDEVVTGLRYALGGASELYNISPDLVCMGKGLGNGMPVSALVGLSDLMAEFASLSPVFCSSTQWGNSLNMKAVTLVLSEWNIAKLEYIWDIGLKLMAGLKDAGWRVIGQPPRSLVVFDSVQEQAFFIQGMRDEGFLVNRPNFPTYSHSDFYTERTVQAARVVRAKYKASLERGTLEDAIKGKLPKVLFSNR